MTTIHCVYVYMYPSLSMSVKCLVHIYPGCRAINLSTIFRAIFFGIVGGYGLRHICSHCLLASCDFFYGASGATQGKSVQRLCGDCTEIVQCQCSCRAVPARKSYGARAGIVQCHLRHVFRAYDLFKFVKLLVTPNRRGREARESVRKSHSRFLPPQRGLVEAARKGG